MKDFGKIARDFCIRYIREAKKGGKGALSTIWLIWQFYRAVKKEMKNRTTIAIYHEAIPAQREFGLQLFRPLIDKKTSLFFGKENVKEIEEKLERGENVILLANHQTEPDPQAISVLLEEDHPRLSKEMIFVAGDRVVRDPMAIPLSLGCNLLCIYSKKYIATPPEEREEKLLHNKRTLNKMEELLRGGGKIIYVAASGGRDRKDREGKLQPALFTPESVELLYLIAKRGGTKTAFHTLALKSYDLLPPPIGINVHLGETRLPARTPVHLFFGKELNLEDLPDVESRHEMRNERARIAYHQLLKDYEAIDR